MQLLPPGQVTALTGWFAAERPGPLIGPHVLTTGCGTCQVDTWPEPRAVLAETAGNYSLTGHPDGLDPGQLASRVRGFVEAAEQFTGLVWAAFPAAAVWHRIIFEQRAEPDPLLRTAGCIRPLQAADADQLARLDADISWICDTWGGPQGLAASGFAHGAFAGDRLVSVACSFFVGRHYEDIGVVTEPGFRGQGLSTACATAQCHAIRSRGRRPSWTTSPENAGSRRVAEKLGFTVSRKDRLFACGVPIPAG